MAIDPERTDDGERSPCPTAPALMAHIGAVDFPISKDDLLARADERGVPEEVRQTLEALEPVVFASGAELDEAVDALSR